MGKRKVKSAWVPFSYERPVPNAIGTRYVVVDRWGLAEPEGRERLGADLRRMTSEVYQLRDPDGIVLVAWLVLTKRQTGPGDEDVQSCAPYVMEQWVGDAVVERARITGATVKEVFTYLVRNMASQYGATAVFFGSESWALKRPVEMDELRSLGSLANHPDASPMLSMMSENSLGGGKVRREIWMAPVLGDRRAVERKAGPWARVGSDMGGAATGKMFHILQEAQS